MATFGPRFGDDDLGTLSLEKKGPGLVDVYFQPSATRLAIAHRENDPTARVLLLRFDGSKRMTTLFPKNTMPTSAQFLEPKHDPIVAIDLVEENGFFDDFDVPNTVEDVEAFLAEGMPSGFTKDPNYGLGLDRKLSFLIHALSEVEGITTLRLSNERTLDVAVSKDGTIYEMGYTLFGTLRRDANRFDA
ncbi:MAG: hypothetical protein E5X60_36935, partial [Mesorhizobium sp.]